MSAHVVLPPVFAVFGTLSLKLNICLVDDGKERELLLGFCCYWAPVGKDYHYLQLLRCYGGRDELGIAKLCPLAVEMGPHLRL